MISNIGEKERLVRIFFGSLFIGWGMFFGNQLGNIMFALGIAPLVTGLTGNCLLYTIHKNNYLDRYKNSDLSSKRCFVFSTKIRK